MAKTSADSGQLLVLYHQGDPVPLQVVRSQRRTLAVHLNQQPMQVRAPSRVSDAQLRAWLTGQLGTLLAKQERLLARYNQYRLTPIEQGYLPYQGNQVSVQVSLQPRQSHVIYSGDQLLLVLNQRIRRPAEQVADEQLRYWLQQQAQTQLRVRTAALARQLGLRPARVRIGNFKRRWGQCSSTGEIALNWRLLLATPEACDYVIIHELCHLWELNHSHRFWALVGRYCPAYEQQRSYLHARGSWLDWR